MDTKEVFDSFLKDLKNAFPDITIVEYNIDQEVKNIEDNFFPSVMKVIQRDETFFTEAERVFCGVNLSELWTKTETTHEAIWKHMFMIMIGSFFHGDMNQKLEKLLDTAKNIWSASGHENDEISKILNDDHAEDKLKEILEYLQNTRLAKLFLELVEETNLEELTDGLNFENPAELVEMIKNPDNPQMKNIIAKVQQKIQTKMQQGQFTQQQLLGEIEGIKLKIQSMFGNVINEMLGGRRADVASNVLVGNSPEARRQRMLARLQRKQREKTSH
jgi:hypothetical protein